LTLGGESQFQKIRWRGEASERVLFFALKFLAPPPENQDPFLKTDKSPVFQSEKMQLFFPQNGMVPYNVEKTSII